MRLFQNEHDDVTRILKAHNLGKEILLTKKKGWIHIKISNDVFSYHRKKETRLIQGKFEDDYRYFVEMNREKRELANWEEVCLELEAWIDQIQAI